MPGMPAPGSFLVPLPPPQDASTKVATATVAANRRNRTGRTNLSGPLNTADVATDRKCVTRPVSVVVADDDDVLRSLLVLNLEAEGMNVHEAENGAKALQYALTHRPDLMVLDVMMPVHDGLKVLRALKDEPTTADIPVVLLTARAAPAEIEEGWAAGADYYLTKPFHIEQLLDFIDDLRVA